MSGNDRTMNSPTIEAARPTIHLIDNEADALANLALEAEDSLPQVSALLLEEIGRAQLHRAAALPAGTISMHSTVTYRDEASATERTVEIVYPAEADIAAGRISILTPIGVGLIGLRQGTSIAWPDRNGRVRRLSVIDVRPSLRGENS